MDVDSWSDYQDDQSYGSSSDWSDIPTPHKRGVSAFTPGSKHNAPAVYRGVARELKDYTAVVSTRDFITKILNITPSELEEVQAYCESNEYRELHSESLKPYIDVLREHEDRYYTPFSSFFTQLQERLRGRFAVHGQSLSLANLSRIPIESQFNSRKPDAVLVNVPEAEVRWGNVYVCMEIKPRRKPITKKSRTAKGMNVSREYIGRDEIFTSNTHSGNNSQSSQSPSVSSPSRVHKPCTPLISRPKSSLAPHVRTSGSASPAISPIQSDTLRGSTPSQSPIGSEVSTSGKGRITRQQSQLAGYAFECMCAANRGFVIGLFLKGLELTLWYFDRMGAIKSEPIVLDESIVCVAQVIHALNLLTAQSAGFRCLPPSSTTDMIPFTFPSLGNDAPIIFDAHPQPLHIYRGLIGRGTWVYQGKLRMPSVLETNQDYVLKMSWPSCHRIPEAQLMEIIISAEGPLNSSAKEAENQKRIRLGDALRNHLPQITHLTTTEFDQHDLPRTRLLEHLSDNLIDKRNFHAIAIPVYEHLWSVQNLDQFVKIFIDAVECHYLVYKYARILHRDISLRNLMYHEHTSGLVSGVVIDWDLASEVTADGIIDRSNAKARTGTLPFIAISLSVDDPPRHEYHHDLESFFWVLVWLMFFCNLESHAEGMTDPPPILENWFAKDVYQVKAWKSDFSSIVCGLRWIMALRMLKCTPNFDMSNLSSDNSFWNM